MDTNLKGQNPAQVRGNTSASKSEGNGLVLGGAIVLLLLGIIAVVNESRNESNMQELALIQANLNHLDVRLRTLEKIESRITFLEEQDKGLRESILEADWSGDDLSEELARLSEHIRRLQNRLASAEKQPVSEVTKNQHHEHHVRWGDTLYRIARTYDTSVDELRRLNGLTPKQPIHAGEKLIIPTASRQ